jgi:hypothetical protein
MLHELSHVPHVPVDVLGVEDEFGLAHRVVVEVTVPADVHADPVDHLRQAGHDEDHAPRDPCSLVIECTALPHETRPRNEWEVLVIDHVRCLGEEARVVILRRDRCGVERHDPRSSRLIRDGTFLRSGTRATGRDDRRHEKHDGRLRTTTGGCPPSPHRSTSGGWARLSARSIEARYGTFGRRSSSEPTSLLVPGDDLPVGARASRRGLGRYGVE